MHLPNLAAAMLVVVFSVGYLLACLPAGYNSRTILIASIISLMILSAPIFYSSRSYPSPY